MFTKASHNQNPVVSLFLFPLFLVSINSALGLPLLSMVMGNSHEAYLTYEHGKIHLNFCHHENNNTSGVAARNLHEHEHACSYSDYAIFSSGQSSHVDHEFHISSLIQQNIATVKTYKVLEISTPRVAIDWSTSEYFYPASIKHFPQTFSEINSTLFSLRKVVLLI